MALPSSIRLIPGQYIVQININSGVTPITTDMLSIGTIVQVSSEYMSFATNQVVAFNNGKTVFFKQGSETFGLINEVDVYFQIEGAAP